jgi:hypothetical protein
MTIEEEVEKIINQRKGTLILGQMDLLQLATIAAAAKAITDLLPKVDIVIKDPNSISQEILLPG